MTTSHAFLRLLLLWLANNGLRITILAARQVIPLICTDLGMSETQVTTAVFPTYEKA